MGEGEDRRGYFDGWSSVIVMGSRLAESGWGTSSVDLTEGRLGAKRLEGWVASSLQESVLVCVERVFAWGLVPNVRQSA